jgi:hypothetical protein
MSSSSNAEPMSIRREGDVVILTMSPQRAQIIAASIWLGEANHRAWLDDLATMMEAAAEGRGVFDVHGSIIEGEAVPADVALQLPLPRNKLLRAPDLPLDHLHAVAAETVALAWPTDVSVAIALAAVSAQAAQAAEDEVAEAAAKTARAAEDAKVARAVATAKAAEAVAEIVRLTAASVQSQADADVKRVAATTADTALLDRAFFDTELSDGPNQSATLAAAAVFTAAEATAAAAAIVARAAEEAALNTAATAADVARSIELEVAAAAAEVAAVADETARRLAARATVAADLVLGLALAERSQR